MKFTPLGGANEVGASCSLLQVGGRNILVDAGIRVNRRYGAAPILTTVPTKKLTSILLQDAVRIMSSDEREEEPLFDEQAVQSLLWKIDTVPFHEWVEPLPGIRVRWHPSGHIV